MRFENKTAVVTGGSRGIGLAIATKLAKEGANIAILYVGDENEGIKAKEELSQYGTKVEQYFCDVSNFEESKKVVDKVIEDFGSIEILVNNAGITRDKLVLNMDEKDFDAVINVNLKGTFNMIKHTYKHFMKKDRHFHKSHIFVLFCKFCHVCSFRQEIHLLLGHSPQFT